MDRKGRGKRPTTWFLLIAFIIVATGFAGVHFFCSRKAVEVSYTSGELIFSPGPFYALDGYQEEPIYIYNTVLQPYSVSGPDYVFRVANSSGLQYLIISYHDFTGKIGHTKFEVQSDDSNGFILVSAEDYSVSYLFSA